MKLLVTLLIGMFIHSSKAYSPYSHWKDRMSAYGMLVQCEYYLTSEDRFSDLIEFVNETPNNGTRFRFFSLTKTAIKFRLNGSKPKPHYNRYDTTTYPSTDSTIDYPSDATYEFVIGGTVYENNQYTGTYVEKDGERLKTLATPGIIRTDQPNEVIVEILKGDEPETGEIHLTINKNTPFHISTLQVTDIKYIGFVSMEKSNAEEFFYNCDLN